MRIAVIGPSYPFRGGISLNTTLLYRALKLEHEVLFISFKRQYPQLLFPGESDKEPEFTFIFEKDAVPVFDSMNPFSWIRTVRYCIKFNAEIVIIPWWVVFWFPHFITIIILLKMFSKAKILMICHNVFEHEDHPVKRFLSKKILSKADYLIVHSEEDRRRIDTLDINIKAAKLWLPVFDYKPWMVGKNEARRQVGFKPQEKVIVYFGIIRPYKGIKYLLQAVAKVKNTLNLKLGIIGEFWEGKDEIEKEIDELDIKANIYMTDKFIPSDKIGIYLSAADVVILPYITATGSGTLQVALSCGKPVIATKVGCFPDIIRDGKTGLLVEPADSDDLARKIIKFYDENLEAVFIGNIKKLQEELSLESICKSFNEIISKDGKAF